MRASNLSPAGSEKQNTFPTLCRRVPELISDPWGNSIRHSPLRRVLAPLSAAVAGEPPMDKEEDERSRLARRQLLQKHLPADEETLKLHLERLIFVSGRIRSKKAR